MKNLYLLFVTLLSLGITNAQTAVTFEVNTANITVGAGGIYLGGGAIGSANEHQMTDDGTGIWSVTIDLAPGTSGNYIFLNSPTDANNWDAKEQLVGQSCADPDNFNDRILPTIGTDPLLIQHCYGSCEDDGTCPTIAADAEPSQAAPTPTHNAAGVMSLQSAHYTQAIIYSVFDPGWGQATDLTVETINGEPILKFKNLNYQGHDITEVDVSSMTHVHMDVWSENGGDSFRFFPLDGSAPEPHTALTTLQAGWNSFDFELATLPNGNFGGTLKQMKYDSGGDNNVLISLMYVANVYFYNSATASTNKLNAFNLSLYPNPVKNIVNITTGESIDMVRIYDLTGRMVKQANPNSSEFSLNVADLSKGAYLVRLNAGDKQATAKLIK